MIPLEKKDYQKYAQNFMQFVIMLCILEKCTKNWGHRDRFVTDEVVYTQLTLNSRIGHYKFYEKHLLAVKKYTLTLKLKEEGQSKNV